MALPLRSCEQVEMKLLRQEEKNIRFSSRRDERKRASQSRDRVEIGSMIGSRHENGRILGRIAGAEKSNELTKEVDGNGDGGGCV